MKTLRFKASFGTVPCPWNENATMPKHACASLWIQNCSMSLKWEELIKLERKGKAFTGGLGKAAVKNGVVEYGLWVCVRDWDEEEQLTCGARHNELACFWYEEKSQGFHFKGFNSEVRMVSPQRYAQGIAIEAKELLGRTFDQSTHIADLTHASGHEIPWR
jgi:hypothetical protein